MSASRILMLALPLSVALFAGCNRSFNDDSKVLAVVNGENITEKDLNNYQQLRQRQQRTAPLDDKERKVVLDELTERILLTQHGVALGLDKSEDVYFGMKRVRENLIARQVIRNTIKDRYEKKVADTKKVEYKVRHILVKTEDEAKQLAKQLKSGAKFETLAKAKSLDTGSAKEGGDLNWISPVSGLVPEFVTAMSTLDKGQTSEPVKSQFGWHLIKVEDTRPLEIPTFDAALTDPRMSGFLGQLQQESMPAMQQTLADLKAKAKITTN